MNSRDIDHLMIEKENKEYYAFMNTPSRMLDIFGSEESQITIEGKYQHVINYDKLMDRIINLSF